MPTPLAIVTRDNDLHGCVVQNALNQRDGVECHLISADRLCDTESLTWYGDGDARAPSTVLTTEGVRLAIRDVSLVWWRRGNTRQTIPPDITTAEHVSVIHNDCAAALTGLFTAEFRGRWINPIEAARRAENKLVQLRVAQAVGFRTPRTLVSNEPAAIRTFFEDLGRRAIVKAVAGSGTSQLYTRMLMEEHLAVDDHLRLSPAIYQEYITGERHVRAHCFGAHVYAVSIVSEHLDWREHLDQPFTAVTLDATVVAMLGEVLRRLDLRMGIVDLKLTRDGQLVWLEINQQGQFLFAEAMSDVNLTEAFASFLVAEAGA